MTMLNEHPRQQLQVIVTRFGHSICDNPKRCEAMLRDLCPENKREVNLLVVALKEKIAHDLLNRPALMPLEATLKSLSQRLQDNHGTAEQFADWAVEAWALSLNLIQKPVQKQPVQPVVKTISTPTKTVKQRIGKFIVRDGIALDTETNLIWCRFAYGQTWENDTAKGDAKLVDWKTAFEVADQFNQQGGYQGYTDWRLPTIDELKTLIDIIKGMSGNYIDADVFPNNNRWTWSSSSSVGYSLHAWFVHFYYGNSSNENKSHSNAVRLVRNKTPAVAAKTLSLQSKVSSTPTTPPSSQRIGKFIVQDGIATDTTTSLMWLRFAYGQNWENDTAKNSARQIIWKEAFENVAKQFNDHGGYAGYTDWRLPTTKELKTLIDIIKGNADYCIDTDVFPNSPKWFWSSSPNPGNSYDCWFVYIGNSNGSYPDHSFDIRCTVRLVRGGR